MAKWLQDKLDRKWVPHFTEDWRRVGHPAADITGVKDQRLPTEDRIFGRSFWPGNDRCNNSGFRVARSK